MRRWLEANPDDEFANDVRAKLTSEPERYAAYTREYLGWGVFAADGAAMSLWHPGGLSTDVPRIRWWLTEMRVSLEPRSESAAFGRFYVVQTTSSGGHAQAASRAEDLGPLQAGFAAASQLAGSYPRGTERPTPSQSRIQ